MKRKITIEGMSCEHCVKAVTDALKSVEGIRQVEVNLEEKKAVADMEDSVSEDAIRKAVVDAGYEVISIESL